MEKTTYHYGIHTLNENKTTFDLVKTTDNEAITDFDIINIYGIKIEDEDYDTVLEDAIDLSIFGEQHDFDSVRGDTYTIVKLIEEEQANFLS